MNTRATLLRTAVTLAAVVVAMVPSVNYSASPSAVADQDRDATTAPAVAATQPLPARIDYVALGDSFTAGPFSPLQRTDPLGCFRSTRNYPAFLASALGVRTYVDVSCSAAETADMTSPQTLPIGTNPAQLDSLRRTTDLVTLGIGGNDFGLFGELTSRCPEVRESDPTGSPCKQEFTVDGVDTKMRDAAAIEGRVAAVIAKIHKRSPNATVAVVGYLRLLPPTGTCVDEVPFADGDYAWADAVERRLNASIRNAAESSDASYVNTFGVSKGHDVCAGERAWVNGQTLKPLEAFPYHPFAVGMQAVAAKTHRTLTGDPARAANPYDSGAATLTKAGQRQLATLITGRAPARLGFR